jgi:hypothetical protein
MKRDMEIIRKVLLAIEEQYEDVVLYELEVDGLDMKTIAYHCKVLYDGGFISNYAGDFASGNLHTFAVGSLTWEGHEFLDKIRDETIWEKTKSTIAKEGLPMVLDVVKNIATSIVGEMTKSAIKGLTGL